MSEQNVSLKCDICGKSTSSFFISLGVNSICIDCSKNHKGKIPQLQRPQTFTRYSCVTHGVYTYNLNYLMNAHIMDDCEIISKETLGIIRPATQGGINGDISRKYFLGINDMARLLINLANYKRFIFIHIKARNGWQSKKIAFHDKKYYNKHTRYLLIKQNPDYHKNDEALLKL